MGCRKGLTSDSRCAELCLSNACGVDDMRPFAHALEEKSSPVPHALSAAAKGFCVSGLDMRLRRHLHDPEHIEKREDESSYRERVEDSSASLDPDARGSGIQPEAHRFQAEAAYPIRTPVGRDLDSLRCGLGSPFAPKPSVLQYEPQCNTYL